MGEVQEALHRQGGYETILSHIHNAFTFDNEDEEMPHENAVICKWATYCLCCCLGDVLEPLEFVKAEITNAVSTQLIEKSHLLYSLNARDNCKRLFPTDNIDNNIDNLLVSNGGFSLTFK